ncbi:hypothetical protein Rhopal_006945-T1 [Rhodotorula paludigena]|uniref:Dolichyl-diphosphooligosaccharide--protein glycosyltransferase subunit WBP1 n=1 Tax=Rhodotorula paludigena TaxID=86838 RepID=A0AAV5GMS5_9BASI|nr:hypothetical protein Rhopal_006945-T1 [Rhodotorula paludigena]
MDAASSISSSSLPTPNVRANVEQYAIFCSDASDAVAEVPPELSPLNLARRIEAGTNLVLIVSPDSAEPWRDFAREFEVDFGSRGQQVIDHFGHDASDSGSHTVLSVSLASAPAPFVSDATRRGRNVVYSGAGHVSGQHPQLVSVLHASSTASSADAGGSHIVADVSETSSGMSLVSAFQARNNARVAFVGSTDVLADRFLGRGDELGNAAFARDLLAWVFHQTGQLRLVKSRCNAPGLLDAQPTYRVGTELDVEFTISSDSPYNADDLQLEFGMLDPHLRLDIPMQSQSQDAATYGTRFTIPDRHGVFTLRLDHRRPGWTAVEHKETIAVTPMRHDEYERFIGGAFPYYAGAASVSAAFLLFAALWSLQS